LVLLTAVAVVVFKAPDPLAVLAVADTELQPPLVALVYLVKETQVAMVSEQTVVHLQAVAVAVARL
jgi:hypothetical protein